ncbi:flagellar protein FlaG [Methylophaga sp. OBS1]|jgi:flagellar protein FlaG|uniref:flagellar protein FlaG n=1 Tax=Methylophaga sp. OBS1 TaxID=2991933 RepID=UPI00224DA0E7|nr:flagellar protein FlaG [Methylophaga sp. OBS1]MCX4193854.1 flagellar protein FlaG [Methylophaga sp. OBS1]
MANNELLVQSSLPTLPKQAETKQQATTEVGPAFVVSEKQQTASATSESLEQQETQRQERAEALQEKVAELNDYMQNFNRSLQFTVDENSGDTVVKVIDSETDEVVRQIPSQELLDARNAADKYRGILLEVKV